MTWSQTLLIFFYFEGVNGSLLVSLTGSDSATVTEVALVDVWSTEIKGVVEAQGSGNFLVHIDRIPAVEFVIRVKGQNGSVFFQRQSSTNFRSSNLTITVSFHPRSSPSKSFVTTNTDFCLIISVFRLIQTASWYQELHFLCLSL